jgi:hypothetical protein
VAKGVFTHSQSSCHIAKVVLTIRHDSRQIPLAARHHHTFPHRGFLHWRLSDDGPGASRIVPIGRHPKPFTTAVKYANRKLWNDFGGNPLQYRKPAFPALAESPTHCPNDLSSKTHPIPSNFCCIANRFVPATLKVNFTFIHLLLLHHDPMIRRMRISGFHFVRGRSNGNCSIVRLDQRTETRRSGKLSRMVTGRFRFFFFWCSC